MLRCIEPLPPGSTLFTCVSSLFSLPTCHPWRRPIADAVRHLRWSLSGRPRIREMLRGDIQRLELKAEDIGDCATGPEFRLLSTRITGRFNTG